MGRHTGSILIAGGYGVVGSLLAEDLAPDLPGRLLVGGRDQECARALATRLGNGARGVALDVAAPASIGAALDEVTGVVSCINDRDRNLAREAINRGIFFTDITPRLTELGDGAAYDEMRAMAEAKGSCVVLGTGLVPGLSNVLVRALADRLGGADEIETTVLISARDPGGPALSDYFFQELGMRFDIWERGAHHSVRALERPKYVTFPPPRGQRLAYLFPFSDQVLYRRTLGVSTAVTRLAIEPQWLGRALSAVVAIGGAKLLGTERMRRAFLRARRGRQENVKPGFALRADVRLRGTTLTGFLLGSNQARAAAAGAAGIVRQWVSGDISKPGAWMPEQVANVQRFLEFMRRRGIEVRFPEV